MLLTRPYFRERAVTYARRWALSRNPLFADFTGKGGDCTNFVSQCVLAGCCTENFTPTFGWYYISLDNRAPAFSGVEYFYNFMTGYGGYPPNLTRVGPLGIEVGRGRVEPGDVVQLYDRGDDFYHTLLVIRMTRLTDRSAAIGSLRDRDSFTFRRRLSNIWMMTALNDL